MKNMLIIAAVAAAPIAFAAPAHAQSANDYMRYDEATDPGYQSAVRGNRYYNSYNGAIIYEDRRNTSCTAILAGLLYSRCKSTQPTAVCYTAAGDPIKVSEKDVSYVGGPNAGRPVPRNLRIICGENSYETHE